MIICFPMGGTGQRFRAAGYEVPKPAIVVGGKALLTWARENYQLLEARHLYLPRLSDMAEVAPLLSQGHVWPIRYRTRGPTETLLVSGFPFEQEELLIADCDSLLDPKELKMAIDIFRISGADGGVTIRPTKSPACSFAQIGKDWWVEETREKDPFTEWSTTGPYWWKSGKQFLELAKKAIHLNEYYVSPVYNLLIEQGGKVKAFPVSTFRHLGTPEELKEFEQCLSSLPSPS